jgi:hypothetical protein
VVVVAWLAALLVGKLPASLHNAFAAVLRYSVRHCGHIYLLTDAYPRGLFCDKPGLPPNDRPGGPGYGIPGPGYGAPAVARRARKSRTMTAAQVMTRPAGAERVPVWPVPRDSPRAKSAGCRVLSQTPAA